MHKLSWKQTLGAAALMAGSTVVSQAALAQDEQQDLQGLYSADELMDADVYLTSAPNDDIGDVEDILLGEDMSIQALVIEAGGTLDIGDRDLVVEKGKFEVETSENESLDNIEYRIVLDLNEEELVQQPTYDNDWWQGAKMQASQAWEETKQGASSAWQDTRDATSSLLQDASDALGGNQNN